MADGFKNFVSSDGCRKDRCCCDRKNCQCCGRDCITNTNINIIKRDD